MLKLAESKIQVGISQDYLDTEKLANNNGDDVHREVVVVASPTDFDAKQEVELASKAARVILYDVDGVPFSVANPVPVSATIDEITNVVSVDLVDALTSITNPVTTNPTGASQANVISPAVADAGVIPGNSREASTLAAGATFQGVGETVSGFGRAGIVARSDNATSGTLTIEVSEDGVRWGGPTRYWADTRFAVPHMWNIVEPYFRILYTNGTTEATNLSIIVQYSNNADTNLVHQLNEILPAESEATLVRAGSSFSLEMAREHITGNEAPFFIGHNPSFSSAWEDIWAAGGDVPWLTVATKIEIISSSAADNGTTPGLGVHSVEVHGLSATGEDQKETILTNGTTAVQSDLTYIRVNKVHSEMCGTYGGSHQGNITCRVTGGGATLSLLSGAEGSAGSSVQYGSGEAGNGFWSVPLGKVMYITRLDYQPDVSANKSMNIKLYEREDLLDVTTPFSPRRELWGVDKVNQGDNVEFPSHIKIKPLTDVFFRANATTTSALEVDLDFFLVDEDSAGK